MKLITYLRNEPISSVRSPSGCGVLAERGLIDIPSSWRGANPPHSVKEILERGLSCLEKLAELAERTDPYTPLDSVRLYFQADSFNAGLIRYLYRLMV